MTDQPAGRPAPPYSDDAVRTLADLIADARLRGALVNCYTLARVILDAGYRLVDDDPRHIIDLRADGWTIKHPLSCRPALFDCPVNGAAGNTLTGDGPIGRFEVTEQDGALVLGVLDMAIAPYSAPGMPPGAPERAREIAETMPTMGQWPGPDHSPGAADVLPDITCTIPSHCGTAKPTCTGLAARWCPVHGDCTCPDDGIPELHIAPTLDDPQCPLHAPGSEHGEANTGSKPGDPNA